MTQTVRRRESIAIAFPFFSCQDRPDRGDTLDLEVEGDIYANRDRRTCRTRTVVSLNSTRELCNTIEHFVDVASWTPPSLPQVSNLFQNW